MDTLSTQNAPSHPLYNVIGYVSGNFGLAVAARNGIETLLATGRQVAATDIDPGGGRHGIETSHLRPNAAATAHDCQVNLFHMNPIEIAQFARQWRPHVDLANPNACAPFWELPRLPESWLPLLSPWQRCLHRRTSSRRHASLICRESGYFTIRKRCSFLRALHPTATDGTCRRIRRRSCALSMRRASADAQEPDRSHRCMDQAAFGPEDDVVLLIKTKAETPPPTLRKQADELEKRAAANPRVRLVRESLSYRELLSLYASCDVRSRCTDRRVWDFTSWKPCHWAEWSSLPVGRATWISWTRRTRCSCRIDWCLSSRATQRTLPRCSDQARCGPSQMLPPLRR